MSSLYAREYRQDILLEKGWKFTREDGDFTSKNHDDSAWQEVTVPHDWAIYGPFDANNDAQVVAIEQNFERRASLKTGRTGGLPYVGVGWYRTQFDVPDYKAGKQVQLLFDGAMSQAKVYVNEQFVGEWPYGYNSFHFDVTPYLNADGQDNVLAVRLENLPESSRWYPGAGLYRNVHLVVTNQSYIPIWGTQVITPEVSEKAATVDLKISLVGAKRVRTVIRDASGKKVAVRCGSKKAEDGRRV